MRREDGVDHGLLLRGLSRLLDFCFSPGFPTSGLLLASRFVFFPVYPVTVFLSASRLAFFPRFPGLFSTLLPGHCSPPDFPVCTFLPASRFVVLPASRSLLSSWLPDLRFSHGFPSWCFFPVSCLASVISRLDLIVTLSHKLASPTEFAFRCPCGLECLTAHRDSCAAVTHNWPSGRLLPASRFQAWVTLPVWFQLPASRFHSPGNLPDSIHWPVWQRFMADKRPS